MHVNVRTHLKPCKHVYMCIYVHLHGQLGSIHPCTHHMCMCAGHACMCVSVFCACLSFVCVGHLCVSVNCAELVCVCMQVIPIWLQLHIDGVQVRKVLSHNPMSITHINATPYNAGEQFRRTAALRWRLGLLYTDWPKRLADKIWPKLGIIRGTHMNLFHERTRKAKALRVKLNKRMYKKLADHMEELRTGFEFTDMETGIVYWIKVYVLSSIFDLPAMAEATGLVCCVNVRACLRHACMPAFTQALIDTIPCVACSSCMHEVHVHVCVCRPATLARILYTAASFVCFITCGNGVVVGLPVQLHQLLAHRLLAHRLLALALQLTPLLMTSRQSSLPTGETYLLAEVCAVNNMQLYVHGVLYGSHGMSNQIIRSNDVCVCDSACVHVFTFALCSKLQSQAFTRAGQC